MVFSTSNCSDGTMGGLLKPLLKLNKGKDKGGGFSLFHGTFGWQTLLILGSFSTS